MIQFLQNNWAEIAGFIVAAIPVIDIIVRLTPTKTDDTVLSILKKVLDKKIPNKKKGGGTHV